MINFNLSSTNKSDGEFALYQNKKTGKIDMITYEVDRVAVMILKKNGKWRTLKDLKNFSYGKKIGNKALKLILKRAKNAENIRMASSPTLIRSNFTF